MIEDSKKQQIAVSAVNPKGLPRIAWSGPFVKSAGGNRTTPLGERLREGWPTLHSFSFGIDQIPAAALLVWLSREPPPGGCQFAVLIFGRDDKVLLLRCDVVAWAIIGERDGGDAESVSIAYRLAGL